MLWKLGGSTGHLFSAGEAERRGAVGLKHHRRERVLCLAVGLRRAPAAQQYCNVIETPNITGKKLHIQSG